MPIHEDTKKRVALLFKYIDEDFPHALRVTQKHHETDLIPFMTMIHHKVHDVFVQHKLTKGEVQFVLFTLLESVVLPDSEFTN